MDYGKAPCGLDENGIGLNEEHNFAHLDALCNWLTNSPAEPN